MGEAEVQSLVALIGSSGQIMLSVFFTHSIPLRRTFLVDVDVEPLRSYHEYDVEEGNAKQSLNQAIRIDLEGRICMVGLPCWPYSNMVHHSSGRY